MEVDGAVCPMLQHRPAAASGLHITEHLWKLKQHHLGPLSKQLVMTDIDVCRLLNVSLAQCMYIVLYLCAVDVLVVQCFFSSHPSVAQNTSLFRANVNKYKCRHISLKQAYI